MCHPILVPSYLQEFDDAHAKVGADRTPQKTEVIYHVDDLGAPPPEWRLDDMQNMAKVSTAGSGSITLGVAVGPRQFTAEWLLAKADVTRAMHERVQLVSGPADRICSPPPEFGSWPHQRHPASTRPHNPSGTAGCSNPRGLGSGLSNGSGCHGRQCGTPRRPWTWIQGSATQRGSALGCTRSQTAHPSHDPRWSQSWSSAEVTPGNSLGRSH